MDEELANALTNIADYAVNEQDINSIKYHKITLEDNTTYIIGIWKDKDKYKINVNGYTKTISNS